jgi:hypothetical protein
MNSREKGKRGERQWRDELRAQGYAARRGQQFSGSPESPDVVCPALPWIHFEVKAVERLNIEEAMEQARRDAGAKTPIVAHRRSFRPWLVTMEAETFFRLLRGDFTGANGGNGEGKANIELPTSNFQLRSGEGTEGTQRTQGTAENSRFQILDFKGLSGPEKETNNQKGKTE